MDKKLIFTILAILLITELSLAAYYLTRPLPVPQPAKLSSTTQGAVLSLVPSSGQIKVGQSAYVKINLNTNGQPTDGTRAVVLFDPSQILVEEIHHKIALYANYPVQEIDNKKGRVVIYGIIDPKGKTFTGSGTVATLKIRPLVKGPAVLNFEFIPGKTTDSNVALHGTGTDILQKVNGAVYSVEGE